MKNQKSKMLLGFLLTEIISIIALDIECNYAKTFKRT